MDRIEAAKLLELIVLSYPNAYRGMEDKWKVATINMWHMSFPDVPYPIIEQAFNHFRMVSKYPPTVAEMVEELRNIHNQAIENALVCKAVGDNDRAQRFMAVMECTKRYKNDDYLGGLNIDTLPRLGGGGYVGLPGSPGDNLG